VNFSSYQVRGETLRLCSRLNAALTRCSQLCRKRHRGSWCTGALSLNRERQCNSCTEQQGQQQQCSRGSWVSSALSCCLVCRLGDLHTDNTYENMTTVSALPKQARSCTAPPTPCINYRTSTISCSAIKTRRLYMTEQLDEYPSCRCHKHALQEKHHSC
jgi:hypothetical protein